MLQQYGEQLEGVALGASGAPCVRRDFVELPPRPARGAVPGPLPGVELPLDDCRIETAVAVRQDGAAKAIGLVLPQLQGKLDGIAVRAPVATGSVTDLVVQLGTETTRDQVIDAYREAAGGPLGRYLQFSEAPLVSTDIIRSPYSCIFDSELTMTDGSLAKVFGWYDNEWGYSCRLVDLVTLVGTAR